MRFVPTPSRTAITAILATACATTLGAMLAAPVHAQSQRIPLAVAIPDDASAGAALFRDKSCARCHAVGRGGSGIGPNLGALRLEGSVLDLAGAMWNHAPTMAERMLELGIERPSMARGEMANLVAWLTAFQRYSRQLSERSNPALGRNVFVSKGCAACHEGPEASTTPGPDLQALRGQSPEAFAQSMWNHSPEMAAAMDARDVPWPMFADREMTDLTAYLQVGLSLAGPDPSGFEPGSPSEGEALFATKGCIACHTVAGRGGTGGPDLAEPLVRVRSVAEIAGSLWNHTAGMRPEFDRRNLSHPTFRNSELTDLLAYLYLISYTSVEGDPVRGAVLFVEKCSACHAMGRVEVGPDLTSVANLDDPIAIVADMWNHAATMQATARERNTALPQFEPGEVADLLSFLLERRAR